MTASSIHRAQRRVCALVTVFAVCSTLAACGADPPPDEKQQPILTEKSVVEVWKDYDKRNNASLVKTGPPSYDQTAFEVVDIGPMLDEDVTSVQLDELAHGKRGKPFSHTPKTLYAPAKSAGFALNTIVPSTQEDKANESLTSILPVGDPATWKMEMRVQVPRKDLPRPLEPGLKSTASKADVEKARKVVTSISEYWRTHRKPAEITLGYVAYADWVKTHATFSKSKYDASSEAVPEGIPTTPGAGKALRVVRAKGGLLVLVNIPVRYVLESHEKGATVNWRGIPGKLYGTKPAKMVRSNWSASLAISVPDKGRPKVLGATYVPLVS